MIDVNVRGGRPGGTVVRREPASGRGGAGAVGHHVAAVTLEDILADTVSVYLSRQNEGKIIPSIAGPANGAPGREQIAVILAIIIGGLDGEAGELGLCRGG